MEERRDLRCEVTKLVMDKVGRVGSLMETREQANRVNPGSWRLRHELRLL